MPKSNELLNMIVQVGNEIGMKFDKLFCCVGVGISLLLHCGVDPQIRCVNFDVVSMQLVGSFTSFQLKLLREAITAQFKTPTPQEDDAMLRNNYNRCMGR